MSEWLAVWPKRGFLLKIHRAANGEVIFRLAGRIDAESVAQMAELFALEEKSRQMILDLKDVTLLNRDAVLFLSACETNAVELRNCPVYIREWINRERGQSAKAKKSDGASRKGSPRKKM